MCTKSIFKIKKLERVREQVEARRPSNRLAVSSLAFA